MKKLAVVIMGIATLAVLPGCSDKPKPLPFVTQSNDLIIESSNREASVDVSKILQLTIVEPVQHDELDCVKGPSHIRVKKKGSLQDSFDDLVDAGWDCVLILD